MIALLLKKPIKIILLLGLVLLIGGCSAGFKQRYTNFRSYYNTYYNANLSFERGLRVQYDQKREINPELPVRIHPPAVRAGSKEFQNSIDKSANLLRNYPKSKWTDNAVFLIGKSYFFQQELFSALEKFTELYTISNEPVLKQQAIYWRGRTLLELKSYQQAIDYLTSQLADKSIKWSDVWRAETQAVLAEIYVATEEFSLASEALEPALGKLERSDENAFAYFLYGQLLEKAEKAEEALAAYKKVPKFNPIYDVIYHARRKEAEIARNQGYFKDALKLFTRMARDDKNFDIMGDLNYEIAKTRLTMGEYNEAEELYYELLYESIMALSNEAKAKAYNDLGVIFRRGYGDLFTAQAYFDSSAAVRPNLLLMPEDYNAPELADNLGKYVTLRVELDNKDSLLTLGRMPKAQFDSVITVIKEQKQREFEEQERERRRQQNTLVNLSAGAANSQNVGTSTGTNGFLNHKNEQLVQDNSRRFKAIWGDRPLVPMWRRIEAVRTQQITDEAISDSSSSLAAVQDPSLGGFNIDLSEIPFTKEAQLITEREIAIRAYQLGNLFYLQLNEPDSALAYFKKVISFKDSLDIRPQAYYASIEILNNSDAKPIAETYFNSLLEVAPTSIYAQRAAELLSLEDRIDQDLILASTNQKSAAALAYDSLTTVVPALSSASLDTVSLQSLRARSSEYLSFALSHKKSTYGALAYEEAVLPIINWSKRDEAYQKRLSKYFQVQDSVQNKIRIFNAEQDSVLIQLSDSTLNFTEVERDSLQAFADSMLTRFDSQPYFPYLGDGWDLVRENLAEIDSMEVYIPSKKWWTDLKTTLKLPKQFEKEPTITADTTTFYSCEDASWELVPNVPIEQFVRDSLVIPEAMQQLKLFTDVIFELKIDTAGKVLEANLQSELTGSGIEVIMEEQLRQKLNFQPIIFKNKKLQTVCNFTFPVMLGMNTTAPANTTNNAKPDSVNTNSLNKANQPTPVKADTSSKTKTVKADTLQIVPTTQKGKVDSTVIKTTGLDSLKKDTKPQLPDSSGTEL
jgi:tetratricopeptide (TPR) repeat protein